MKTMEEALKEQIANNAQMIVDHEYRVILLELGVAESEVTA